MVGMMTKRFAALIALAALGGAVPSGIEPAAAAPRSAHHAQARASDFSAQRDRRRVRRPRIEINPLYRPRLYIPPLYRRCVDGYELQHRPSGTVLFPYQHCWWVRG
jgi:hypothetical protein